MRNAKRALARSGPSAISLRSNHDILEENMSNEVEVLEAEIKEYKIQVKISSPLDTVSSTKSTILLSLSPSNRACKWTQKMRSCKSSRQSLKKSFSSNRIGGGQYLQTGFLQGTVQENSWQPPTAQEVGARIAIPLALIKII